MYAPTLVGRQSAPLANLAAFSFSLIKVTGAVIWGLVLNTTGLVSPKRVDTLIGFFS
jgi:hypothetical protein